jgi:hypothetical protein
MSTSVLKSRDPHVGFKANWDRIRRRKESHPCECKIRDHALGATPGILRKLTTPQTGPYPVTEGYNNGTIQIIRGPVSERKNKEGYSL